MNWSVRRKLFYLVLVVLFAVAVSSYFLIPLFKENPTCFDGKQNGEELGVDCGGACTNLCLSQVRPLSILWQRSFQVTTGIYDTLGYVENQNSNAGIPVLLYRFKLYDEKNILVAERDGKTFMGPNQSWAIFESGIKTGERIPKRAFLEFADIQWVKIDPSFEKVSFSVTNKNLSSTSTTPRLSTTISNDSLIDLKNVEVVAIIHGEDDNAIASSKTTIDSLPKRSSKDAFFTWLSPIHENVGRIEVIPRVNPFSGQY